MATVTYKVVSGDTLSEIIMYKYYDQIAGKDYNAKLQTILKLNPQITNPDYIIAGDTLTISGVSQPEPEENKTAKATVIRFGLVGGSGGKLLYAQWTWNKNDTEKYQIRWNYKINGREYVGSSSSISVDEHDPEASKYCTYSIPDGAEEITFQVKPIGKTSANWGATWSTKRTYYFVETPGAPTVEFDKDTLTINAFINSVDINADEIEFGLLKDNKSFASTIKSTIRTDRIPAVSAQFTGLQPGSEYAVRCRGLRDGYSSAWSPFSNAVKMMPSPSSGITTCMVTLVDNSEDLKGVYLEWGASETATSYKIRYSTDEDDFTQMPDSVPSTTTENTFITIPISDLETGNIYYFQVQAVNDSGGSTWTETASSIIGSEPAEPTTWSSTITANVGDQLNLYWAHNSTDGSSERQARLTIRTYHPSTEPGEEDVLIDTETIDVIKSTNIDEKDKTSVWELNTESYTEVTKIDWYVKTRGISEHWSDQSITRTVYIYPDPGLSLGISDTEDGGLISELTSLPLYVSASTADNGQLPIEYHISIKANESYDTVDNVGNNTTINEGGIVYSKHIPVESISNTDLDEVLTASDLNLENGISYTISCVVSMDTGLTDEDSKDFTVAWSDDLYWPDATIEVNEETLVANVSPFCMDNDNNLIEDVLLSVYRRETNGSFVKIAENLENNGTIAVIDPHPALDYARYRIVAISKNTGAISYYDKPGHLVGEKSAVIQWDEEWSEFDISNDDEIAQDPWSGCVLKLPYNLDVSDSYSTDVSHVKYIGREHPVSYYGTQLGETSTWNLEIDKSDTETIHTLRRLARWMGDVYVREPSGNGYWASITISLPTKHCEVTIPVSISITRVEGGV